MRAALLAATALWPVVAFAQAGSNNFSALPTNGSPLAVMQNNAVASDEFSGNNITLPAGSITAGSGQSITAPDGNVYSLEMMGNMPMGVLYMNGSPAPGASQYIDAIVLSGNTVYAEDGKGHGWFSYQNGNWSGPVSAPGQTDGTISGSSADTTTASPSSGPSAASTNSGQSCPGMTLPGAVTPSGGTFTANGSTYSIDAANGDVASINGAPINQGAYETSQLVQGSDGAIYGQSNAAANNGQWFTLQGSGGDTWWQASSAPLTAVSGGSATTASTSTDTTAQDRVASVVCPQIATIQAQISAANQQMQQLMAQQAQLTAQQQMAAPVTSTAPAVTAAPADSITGSTQ